MNDLGQRKVLFLCSGNYYRSRFAEILFNHLARQHNSGWVAESRGLAYPFYEGNVGPISAHAVKALNERQIPLAEPIRYPAPAEDQDFSAAHHIVAVKEDEHRSLLEQKFGTWVDRVEFWQIHDLDVAEPQEAIPQLDQAVRSLYQRLVGP